MHFYHVKSYLSKFKGGKLNKVHELKKITKIWRSDNNQCGSSFDLRSTIYGQESPIFHEIIRVFCISLAHGFNHVIG